VPVVQGLSNSAAKVGVVPWTEIVLNRLEGQHVKNGSSPTTLAAEAGLGLPRCAYWYVGRRDAIYGRALTISYVDATAPVADVLSPLDTGGWWLAKTPSTLTQNGRVQWLTTHSYNLARGLPLFLTWIDTHYPGPSREYIAGIPPRPARIVGTPAGWQGTRPEDWTWELRSALGRPSPAVHTRTPDRVYLGAQDHLALRAELIHRAARGQQHPAARTRLAAHPAAATIADAAAAATHQLISDMQRCCGR
jgi:hypothetical protein